MSKRLTAAERRAEEWAGYKRARDVEEERRRDRVIAEFGGDARALADEILRLRHAGDQLADAVECIQTGRLFVIMPAKEKKSGTQEEAAASG